MKVKAILLLLLWAFLIGPILAQIAYAIVLLYAPHGQQQYAPWVYVCVYFLCVWNAVWIFIRVTDKTMPAPPTRKQMLGAVKRAMYKQEN